MWPDRVSNPGSLTYESGALPIALRCPAAGVDVVFNRNRNLFHKPFIPLSIGRICLKYSFKGLLTTIRMISFEKMSIDTT